MGVAGQGNTKAACRGAERHDRSFSVPWKTKVHASANMQLSALSVQVLQFGILFRAHVS